MKLAIGCPIFEREWCFDWWADSVEAQQWPSFIDSVEYHFVYTPGSDDTLGAINHRFLTAEKKIIEVKGSGFPNAERANPARYAHLALLRNKLLDSVRTSGADYFLSWDSDMVFEPVLHELFIFRQVAGAFVEMLGQDWMLDSHPEAAFASWMLLDPVAAVAARSGRPVMPSDPPRKVGVVMGTVLFERSAFELVEYEFHPQGEDIGMALSCRDAGVEQWLVPAARGVHLHKWPGDEP